MKKSSCLVHFLKQFVVLIAFAYTYYVYVGIFCLKSLFVLTSASALPPSLTMNLIFIYLLVFHIKFLLVACFYLLVVFKSHQKPLSQFYLDRKFAHKLNQVNDYSDAIKLSTAQNFYLESYAEHHKLSLKTRTDYGHMRVCLKCGIIQPDRCSHCKTCHTCILKRDHHCPWFNKCIGYSNQKYYICMLSYLASLISFILVTMFGKVGELINSLLANHDFFKTVALLNAEQTLDIFNLGILYLICAILIWPLGLLLINTYCLAFNDSTNVEQNYPPLIVAENAQKSRTICDNLAEIFGSSCLLAYLPVWTTPGDGHRFNFSDKERMNCFCI